MRRQYLIIAVLSGSLVLAACSSKAHRPKTTGAPTTTTTEAVDFCTVARDFVTRTQPALAQDLRDARLNPESFQGRVKDDFEAADRQNADLARSAPDTVRPDMESVASTFHAFFQALQSANYDPSKVPPATFDTLKDPAYVEASGRVNAYASEACGIATPSTTTSTQASSATTRRTTATTFRRTTSTTRRATTTTARTGSTITTPTTEVPTTEVATTAPPATSPPTTQPIITTPSRDAP